MLLQLFDSGHDFATGRGDLKRDAAREERAVPNDVSRAKSAFTRYPVISLGAEYLVMGYLMRRNILAYKAPPNHEGYDVICIHPEPRRVTRQIRIQVKSRLATDHDHGFPVKEKAFAALTMSWSPT